MGPRCYDAEDRLETVRTPGPVDRGRRTFLEGLASTAAVTGPLIVTDRTIEQMRTIYVNRWGGSWTAAEEAAFFKPFTEQTRLRRPHDQALTPKITECIISPKSECLLGGSRRPWAVSAPSRLSGRCTSR
jgi:hypothetical protein